MMYFEELTTERLFEIARFIGSLNQFARCSNHIVPFSEMNRNEQVNLNNAIVYDDKHPYDRQDGLREYRVVADVAWDLDVYDIVALYEKDVYDDMLFRVVEEDIDGEKHLWVSIRDANGCSPYDIIVDSGMWYLA